ncbi:unnamed protein product [Phytomonas sp. Hart1]|nr:unnamed protein product [Phytomonas sp. Hart1]|eukprot:CCW70863.1 unnamed protein product [Phytomonas sp. isolate Hart1]
MSACEHPTSTLLADREGGQTYCTLCGDLISDSQFELDPAFPRGARAAVAPRQRGAGLRALGGSLRPTHTAIGMTATHGRPTIEAARRGMFAIARTLEISDDLVEMALGIYKLALGLNAISGNRSVILTACLYAVCRRERTSHIIYDFSEVSGDNPHAILTYMKTICRVTHTEVPALDPSCLIQRLAEQMDIGKRLPEVVVCALKVLRAMRDDWISCGRRPLGVCAAALLVSCYVFRIPKSPEQVCGMARLTAHTIAVRLNEFSATPAASLESIDTYRPSEQTLPPAFGESSRRATEEDMNAETRELSSLYYGLVTEAKLSQPPTLDRCERWRRFLLRHGELNGVAVLEENLDLAHLTPQEQLHILGLPHTKPIPPEKVEASVKREEEKLMLKQEDSASRGSSAFPNRWSFQSAYKDGEIPGEAAGTDLLYPSVNLDDPAQFEQVMHQYHELLTDNAEVRGLREDFDFSDLPGDNGDMKGGLSHDAGTLTLEPTQNAGFRDAMVQPNLMCSPSPAEGTEGNSTLIDDASQGLLKQVLYDDERSHAMPWEICVLTSIDDEDCTDLLSYLILDNEERLRRQKIGEALYKEMWARGRARTHEEIERLEELRQVRKRRRRQVILEPATVTDALSRALRGKGAGTVSISDIKELIPGFSFEDDGFNDNWEVD